MKFFILFFSISILFFSCDDSTTTVKDPCNGINCGGEGVGECAIDNDKVISCYCYEGYHSEGLNCIKDGTIPTCEDIECFDNSTCVMTDKPKCVCDENYHLKNNFCTKDINPCEPNPCKDSHKTVCEEISKDIDSYNCKCETGYTDVDGKCEKFEAIHVRLMAANITSGSNQSYQPNGIRMFKALKPDIVMIQEFNYDGSRRDFVNEAFGEEFFFYKSPVGDIPNGIISRYPFVETGHFDDPGASDRDFAYAKIKLPNGKFLWAISAHFKYGKGDKSTRNNEAREVIAFVKRKIPTEDYFAIGGDFNTKSRTEGAINILGELFGISAPWPNGYNDYSDQSTCFKCAQSGANQDTCFNCDWSATSYERDDPYDWVLVDKGGLDSMQVETTYCKVSASTDCKSFPNGLVFDSREYTQDELDTYFSPTLITDCDRSENSNFQHMGVIKDFEIRM